MIFSYIALVLFLCLIRIKME